jgi:hypothetical protein
VGALRSDHRCMPTSPFLHKAFQDATAADRLGRAQSARFAAELCGAETTAAAAEVPARRRVLRPVAALLGRST